VIPDGKNIAALFNDQACLLQAWKCCGGRVSIYWLVVRSELAEQAKSRPQHFALVRRVLVSNPWAVSWRLFWIRLSVSRLLIQRMNFPFRAPEIDLIV
jgi:hypothetical protein